MLLVSRTIMKLLISIALRVLIKAFFGPIGVPSRLISLLKAGVSNFAVFLDVFVHPNVMRARANTLILRNFTVIFSKYSFILFSV